MTKPQTSGPLAATEHAHQCASLLEPLMRYAKSRMRNATLAEDAVSETLLAALESGRSFQSASQASAWVYGVLRHKLVDELRRQGRETPAGDMADDETTQVPMWNGAGAWTGNQDAWSQPDAACSQREFLALVMRCCDDLPRLQRQAFLMREVWDMDPATISRELGVTDGHLRVLVHLEQAEPSSEVTCASPDSPSVGLGVPGGDRVTRTNRAHAALIRHEQRRTYSRFCT